jgi:hypothetical protein
MPTFHILYLRDNVLDHSEEIELRDLLDAIDIAMAKAPELTAEIRCNGTRVGIVGPCPDSGAIRFQERVDEDSDRPRESEIAEEMKVRLRLTS